MTPPTAHAAMRSCAPAPGPTFSQASGLSLTKTGARKAERFRGADQVSPNHHGRRCHFDRK